MAEAAPSAPGGDAVPPEPPIAAQEPVAAMLDKVAAYVKSEAEMSLEDYRLLESMNLAAAAQYSGMAEYSAGLVTYAERLQHKCDDLMPQLAQIDALEAQLVELEDAVGQLDSYSRRLESKFVALQAS